MKKTPYESLLAEHLIKVGDTLSLNFENTEATQEQAIVKESGLLINGEIYNPTSGAQNVLAKKGYSDPVNGWLIWCNDRGESLSVLYKKLLGLSSDTSAHPATFQSYTHKYSKQRDSLFFFGAGISIADGAPLQTELLNLIFNSPYEDIKESVLQRKMNQFIKENFYFDIKQNIYPSLEEVFGFIDYFLSKGESLSQHYSCSSLAEIKNYLIKLIYVIINRKTNRSSDLLSQYWKKLNRISSNTTIATLNYDTLVEDAFVDFFPLNNYLDYCYAIANYDYTVIPPSDQWVNPASSIYTTSNALPVSYKLLKIHGSLSWNYCNCCNQLIVRPWKRSIGIFTDDAKEDKTLFCPYDGNPLIILITPPSFIKDLHHPVISQILIELSNEIRRSNNIIFAGYSLPEADVHIKAVIAKSLKSSQKVFVIDPFLSKEQKRRFLGLSNNCEFLKMTFEDFLADTPLFERAVLG